MARSRQAFVYLPDALSVRVERVRLSRAVGSALPAESAVLREVIERGLDVIEAPAAAHVDVAPKVTA